MNATECEHVDRAVYAKGRCRSCYEKSLRLANPAFAARQRENRRQWGEENVARVKELNRKYPRDPAKARRRMLKRTYNLSEEDYYLILGVQGGVCAICGKPPGSRKLAVDHDHTCCPGKVSCGKCIRGLLCFRCNFGLSYFGESADQLIRAASHVLGRVEIAD